MTETTLIILKPDAVQRKLVGRIIARFEQKGLAIVGGRFMRIARKLAEQHYAEHRDKPFFESLVGFMTGQPVLVLAVRGEQAIAVCRRLVGATNALEAEPGTIRGDFGLSKSYNLVHASDSPDSAKRELGLFFREEELHEYEQAIGPWLAGD